jgi:hypothetical protein
MYVSLGSVVMKINAIKFSTAVASVTLVFKLVAHIILFKFMPALGMELLAKFYYITNIEKVSQNFAFSYESFIYHVAIFTVMMFVISWAIITVYNKLEERNNA